MKKYLYEWERYEDSYLGRYCCDSGIDYMEGKNYREVKKVLDELYKEDVDVEITMIAEVKYMKRLTKVRRDENE